MTISLDRLPFDVLFHIASGLDFDDIIHLSHTCRQLKVLLNERTLCRRAVETHHPHTKEAQLAREEAITYKKALQSVYDRRSAISNAYPFSARVLDSGNSFLYRQGVICVLDGNTVRVSDVHSSLDTVHLDLTSLTRSKHNVASPLLSDAKVSLLYYSDDILAVHVTNGSRPSNSHIYAISTNTNSPHGGRIIQAISIEACSRLFVRHTSRYLYYGTHTGTGDDGHRKWEIHGVSFDQQYPLPKCERPLLLENFHGNDIGSTVAFEIHDNYFYALSNQGTFEVEEVDWTSFYHVIRFPLDQPLPTAVEKNDRLFRRQHAQGPIHDSWTDLTLQHDERTNQLMIVESRREWAQASSRQSRTFYTSDIKFPPKPSSTASSPIIEPSDGPMLPENDIYVDVLGSSDNPNYAPTPERLNWMAHPEFHEDVVSPRSFILARTKFRAYNHSCSSFLDLVEDDRCCNDPSAPPCLRLRIGSRRPAPPPYTTAGNGITSAIPEEDVKYRHSPIRMWPPPARKCPCAARLHRILNPSVSSHSRTIIGVLDERSLVYMVKPGRSYGSSEESAQGTIVLVDFGRSLQCGDSAQKGNMDDERCWQWTVGLEGRCRGGTCQ
ncbi:hypothetical protein P153DRAFT_359141 [Dothidotthia symphoricarpi CBS 119687]|uniref:F-box domain-containing protein n=1 Tax=Dothidotthia symphoricarpi CBS 119687 TaxID=1392245 RepID=A0A6A6A5I0_9PLEO|nr:uncharacterized protein P153DRAFT_359141 [Dothidotthia symphoricarpi CBS 119687]KAF2126796.1 hypothetical protein P153DRAFT_359141 [Dothidotthia symphoricarpi CBS 119687]